jgi:hypothetical protein
MNLQHPKAKRALELIDRYRLTGRLRGHKLPSGSGSFRLLDGFSPVENLDREAVKLLIDSNIVRINEDHTYTLNNKNKP